MGWSATYLPHNNENGTKHCKKVCSHSKIKYSLNCVKLFFFFLNDKSEFIQNETGINYKGNAIRIATDDLRTLHTAKKLAHNLLLWTVRVAHIRKYNTLVFSILLPTQKDILSEPDQVMAESPAFEPV